MRRRQLQPSCCGDAAESCCQPVNVLCATVSAWTLQSAGGVENRGQICKWLSPTSKTVLPTLGPAHWPHPLNALCCVFLLQGCCRDDPPSRTLWTRWCLNCSPTSRPSSWTRRAKQKQAPPTSSQAANHGTVFVGEWTGSAAETLRLAASH